MELAQAVNVLYVIVVIEHYTYGVTINPLKSKRCNRHQ